MSDNPISPPDGAAPDDGSLLIVSDEPVDLASTPLEGWLALGLFWVLGATVAYQFITRYVFNDSAAWTEEIARYLLVASVFIGAGVGVIKNNHIQVDFLYRYLPPRVGRAVALGVDAVRILFFASMVVLMAQLMRHIGGDEMTVVPWPMNVLYAVIELAWLAMTWRSLQLMLHHWRRGYSVLERPDSA
jgi:TRAP-type C4-dicarboxylate transport system permease small subunit